MRHLRQNSLKGENAYRDARIWNDTSTYTKFKTIFYLRERGREPEIFVLLCYLSKETYRTHWMTWSCSFAVFLSPANICAVFYSPLPHMKAHCWKLKGLSESPFLACMICGLITSPSASTLWTLSLHHFLLMASEILSILEKASRQSQMFKCSRQNPASLQSCLWILLNYFNY